MAVLHAFSVLLLQCMLWLKQACVHSRGQTRTAVNLQRERADTLPSIGSAANAQHPQHVQLSRNCSPAVDSKHCALAAAIRYRARPAAMQRELREVLIACLFTQACSPKVAASRLTLDHGSTYQFTAGTLQDLRAIQTDRSSRSTQCRFTILVSAAGVAARSRNFSGIKLCYTRQCPG